MDIQKYKDVLEQRLAELSGQLHDIRDTLNEHHNPDWEELATEREDDEVLETMGITHQHEIAQIKSALDRMAKGEYGYCSQCGNIITPERLDLIPQTPFCAQCAK